MKLKYYNILGKKFGEPQGISQKFLSYTLINHFLYEILLKIGKSLGIENEMPKLILPNYQLRM